MLPLCQQVAHLDKHSSAAEWVGLLQASCTGFRRLDIMVVLFWCQACSERARSACTTQDKPCDGQRRVQHHGRERHGRQLRVRGQRHLQRDRQRGRQQPSGHQGVQSYASPACMEAPHRCAEWAQADACTSRAQASGGPVLRCVKLAYRCIRLNGPLSSWLFHKGAQTTTPLREELAQKATPLWKTGH